MEAIIKQLPIDAQSAARLLTIRQDIFNTGVEKLGEQLYTGEISLGQWQEAMKAEIKGLHTSAGSIGAGGWDNMTQSQWGKVGAQVKQQYRYLQGFAEGIETHKDAIPLRQIQARAKLYSDAAGYTSELNSAPIEIIDQLPWLPKDGSTECLTHCKCYWVLKVVDSNKNYKLVEATWTLGEAEHCDDCMDRGGHVEMLKLPLDVDVPPVVGSEGL